MSNKILSNLFSFDKMISEQVIKLVYYVGFLAIAFFFIRNVYGAFQAGFVGFLPVLLMSIVIAALSVLLWRVFCECIIILFRMYARLGDINKTLGGKNIEPEIPGDDALKAAREAALKAKDAAMERADSLKGSLKKDSDTPAASISKPAAKPAAAPPKRPAPKKAATKTAAKSTAKKPATKKPAAKKTATKKPAAKK